MIRPQVAARETAPTHDFTEKLESLVITTLQYSGWILTLLEAQGIRTKRDITFTHQCHSGMVHWITCQSRRFGFS